MSASDLPDMRENGPLDMARALVTYLDPKRVHQALKDEFEKGIPDIRTVERLRADHLRRLQKPAPQPFKIHDAYYPGDASERAAQASKTFLHRLKLERARSQEFANSAWRRIGEEA